jgi:hypothetical protein
VKFGAFIEGTDEIVHPQGIKENTLSLLPSSDLKPGLPIYFNTFKVVSTTNTPGIRWQWPIKNDPYLKNIVLMFRKVGDVTWTQANVTATTTTSAVSLVNLIEGVWQIK